MKTTKKRIPKRIPEAGLAAALAVGHQPGDAPSPSDEKLFRAFQHNLLSLISHELRTPLMGILNALTLLEEGQPDGLPVARRNAERLNRALAALLDLAALESGTFHARLREVNLSKVARHRVEAHRAQWADRRLEVRFQGENTGAVLADPQKIGRALDLCFHSVLAQAEPGTAVEIRVAPGIVGAEFRLAEGLDAAWDQGWTEALAGFEGGAGRPGFAFGGTLQSEQAFLTRVEEGLGGELLLVHQILKLHGGRLAGVRRGRAISLALELPALGSEEGVRAVLASRAFAVTNELASVALALIDVPTGHDPSAFLERVRSQLFRASDAVYALPEKRRLALVLDDCKAEDAPKLLDRIRKAVGVPFSFGVATCPGDTLDPGALLTIASGRLG